MEKVRSDTREEVQENHPQWIHIDTIVHEEDEVVREAGKWNRHTKVIVIDMLYFFDRVDHHLDRLHALRIIVLKRKRKLHIVVVHVLGKNQYE